MRDLSERDEIREKYADRTGAGAQVERLMGERENAEAYGQEDRVRELDAALDGFGYKAAQVRKAAAEEKAAEERAPEEEARKQPPAQRRPPQERQSSAEQPGKAQG